MSEPYVIYQDKEILVLDKPTGWIVNEAETAKGQNVLQEWLKSQDYLLANSREYRGGIVHRLDKETSGILLVAKTKEAFLKLQAQFKSREVEKTYTALVHDKVESETGEINATVGRLPWRRDRFGIVAGGREAVTFYEAIAFYLLNTSYYTLLVLKPKTGRTHQIRIHLKHIGHPIVSDSFYAGRKTARNDRKWCPRLFLHATKISFIHPSGAKAVEFESNLPSDLKSALDSLEKVSQTP